MTSLACGLDFGTSNSTVGVWHNQQPALVPLEQNETTIPSALFFDNEEQTAFFGRAAIKAYSEGAEGRFMRSLKSILGTSLMEETTQINDRSVTFQNILGFFLAHLKQQTETFLGQPVDSVVLGRPVFFVDDDPEADQKAQQTLENVAYARGFKHVSFQYEPVAAALDYERAVSQETIALIVDMGGGTSDFSVVRVSPEGRHKPDRREDVLSNIGIHIGGTDFDRLLSLKTVMPHLGYGSQMRATFGDTVLEVPRSLYFELATWHKINFLYTRQTEKMLKSIFHTAFHPEKIARLAAIINDRLGHSLAMRVEKGKIDLTDAPSVALDFALIEAGFAPVIHQQDLEQAIHAQVKQLHTTAQTALQMAQLAPSEIEAVFFTGGSTAIPHVRQALLDLVPNATVIDGDRFGSVGMGLALEARRLFG